MKEDAGDLLSETVEDVFAGRPLTSREIKDVKGLLSFQNPLAIGRALRDQGFSLDFLFRELFVLYLESEEIAQKLKILKMMGSWAKDSAADLVRQMLSRQLVASGSRDGEAPPEEVRVLGTGDLGVPGVLNKFMGTEPTDDVDSEEGKDSDGKENEEEKKEEDVGDAEVSLTGSVHFPPEHN